MAAVSASQFLNFIVFDRKRRIFIYIILLLLLLKMLQEGNFNYIEMVIHVKTPIDKILLFSSS